MTMTVPSPFPLLLLLVVPAVAALPLNPKVGEVKGYVKLKTWGNSSLYQLLTDSDYVTEPLLIHLRGSRYGKSVHFDAQTGHVLSSSHYNLGR